MKTKTDIALEKLRKLALNPSLTPKQVLDIRELRLKILEQREEMLYGKKFNINERRYKTE